MCAFLLVVGWGGPGNLIYIGLCNVNNFNFNLKFLVLKVGCSWVFGEWDILRVCWSFKISLESEDLEPIFKALIWAPLILFLLQKLY